MFGKGGGAATNGKKKINHKEHKPVGI